MLGCFLFWRVEENWSTVELVGGLRVAHTPEGRSKTGQTRTGRVATEAECSSLHKAFNRSRGSTPKGRCGICEERVRSSSSRRCTAFLPSSSAGALEPGRSCSTWTSTRTSSSPRSRPWRCAERCSPGGALCLWPQTAITEW